MGKTRIEWTERTWNPVTGCSRVSPGCAHCYAARMAKRLAGRCGYPKAPHEFDVTLHQDRLSEPLKWRSPQRVFVVSMGDLFHEDVPFSYIAEVFGIMAVTPKHTYQVLTKRPERMLEFYEWGRYKYAFCFAKILRNVWIGVTAENKKYADKRIPVLLQIPAAVRFVSVEPMLGHVDLGTWLSPIDSTKIDWVICGGETGPGARTMDVLYARALCKNCADAEVPFFYKGAGTATYLKDDYNYRRLYGRLWEEFPEYQEQESWRSLNTELG